MFHIKHINIMKIYPLALVLALVATGAQAQETYDTAPVATKDLNGTARYVGMGGAMEALGADISTISSNPAGIGMFRRSTVSATLGITSQEGVDGVSGQDKTIPSFDQFGFVYATRMGSNSQLNFAVNYHKSKDFNQILRAAGRYGLLHNPETNTDDYAYGQNKQPYLKWYNGVFDNSNDGTYSMYDHTMMNTVNTLNEGQGDIYAYYPATGYDYLGTKGSYISQFDFNISGSINDRVYLGLTCGVYDVHYESTGAFHETLAPNVDNLDDITAYNSRRITGTGFDVRAGIIVRPFEENSFRFGLYVATPTFYSLTTNTDNGVNTGGGDLPQGVTRPYANQDYVSNSYDFKLYTPWTFGTSIGGTVGRVAALGMTYEYAKYSATDFRTIDGYDYDYWLDDYTAYTSHDYQMNYNVEESLRGVHTLKLGVELKPLPMLALRAGYNYQTAMYNEDAQRGVYHGTDGQLYFASSPGTQLAGSAEFINWGDTHRATFGAGLTMKKWTLDLAYQYSTCKGMFYPFTTLTLGAQANDLDNVCDGVEVKNNRHHVMLTLGYKF